LAQTREFDLITLDMNMPGGFEICSSLKENPFFQTPIVFVSARFCEDDVQRGRDLDVVDFIKKPFRDPVLSRAFCLTPDGMKK